MLFNSLPFVCFFLLVYSIYGAYLTRYKIQNAFLLLFSYWFYASWDVRFLGLLFFTTVLDYGAARWMEVSSGERQRRWILSGSIAINLGLLGVFKYFNFFSQSAAVLLRSFGLHASLYTTWILPVGISFYTFQSMSYAIDVYRRETSAVHSFPDYALYVAFFPHLVAGPIQRTDLLTQIQNPRSLKANQIEEGIFLLLWGYILKMVVADNLAGVVNPVFDNLTHHKGLDMAVAVGAFAMQIYCDFNGYSSIARGLAKLMGFELMVNFKIPYLSENAREFWQRWHVSLSSWFRDYLYIPLTLGSQRIGSFLIVRNLLITMALAGLWHGARWTFVLWGLYHGLLLAIDSLEWPSLLKGSIASTSKVIQFIGAWGARVLTLFCVLIGWVFFRAPTLRQALYIFRHVFPLHPSTESDRYVVQLLFYSLPVVLFELYQEKTGDLLAITKLKPWHRGVAYGFLLTILAMFYAVRSQEFIYFQF